MVKIFRGWAALRRGYLLPDTIRATRQQATLYIRACYAQELKAGLHTVDSLMADHGITVERVVVVPISGAAGR